MMRTCQHCLESWDELGTFGPVTDPDAAIDTAIGDSTGHTTTDIASIIADGMRRKRRGRVVQEAVFPVGIAPRQGVQAGALGRAIRPDVSFVGQDRQRVNLEVDNRQDRSRQHVIDHLRAMRQAQAAGLAPTQNTRSVFVETDQRGRVQRVRHIAYTLDARGRVIRDARQSAVREFPGTRPTVAQALRSGVFDRAPTPRVVRARRSQRRFDSAAA